MVDPTKPELGLILRARAFAEPLFVGECLDTGESTLVHADGVAALLRGVGGSEVLQAASYLVYATAYLQKPREVIAKAFGESFADLAVETTKLVQSLPDTGGVANVCGKQITAKRVRLVASS